MPASKMPSDAIAPHNQETTLEEVAVVVAAEEEEVVVEEEEVVVVAAVQQPQAYRLWYHPPQMLKQWEDSLKYSTETNSNPTILSKR